MSSRYFTTVLVAGALLWPGAFTAAAASPRSPAERYALASLINAMNSEIQNSGAGGREENLESLRARKEAQAMLVERSSRGEPVTPADLEKVVAAFHSNWVTASADRLEQAADAARKRAVLQEREQSLLAKLRELTRTSEDPADFDGMSTDLIRLRRDFYSLVDRGMSEETEASEAIGFVRNWQDYLAAKRNKETEKADMALSSILRPGNGDPGNVIPRSQLLALLYRPGEEAPVQPSSLPVLLQQVHSLEDIQDFLEKADPHKEELDQKTFGTFGPVLQELAVINQAYRSYLKGEPFEITLRAEVDHWVGSSGEGKVAELQAMLIRLVIPRCLGVPGDMQPREAEDTMDYVDRVASEAKGARDSTLFSRAQEMAKVMRRQGASLGQDREGAYFYRTGKNQEIAGQASSAVSYYLHALASGSDLVPATLIGGSLNRLKADHPQEYETGLKSYLEESSRDSSRWRGRFTGPVTYSIFVPAAPKAEGH